MKKIFLSSNLTDLLNSEDYFFFSDLTFFTNYNFNKKNVNYHIISSEKATAEIKFKDEILTNKITINIEKDLYNKLNQIHSKNFSHRYWKIIVGHWLYRFIRAVYFRYKIIKNSFNSNFEFDEVFISNFESYTQSTIKSGDLWLASTDPEWNFNLFSKIINLSFKNKYHLKLIKTNNNFFYPNIDDNLNNSKEYFKKVIEKIFSFLNYLSKNNKIVFKKSLLSFYNDLKLSFFNREIPSYLINSNYKLNPINLNLRKQMDISKANCENFESLVRRLIPDAIPKTFLEDYENIIDSLEKSNWPKYPKIIFTSNSYDDDDFFKIWTSEKIERNKAKYVIGQHGLFDSNEKLVEDHNEYITCDYYLRWGEKKYKKDIELFNLKIVNKKFHQNKNGNILIMARTKGHEVETYSRMDEFIFYEKCLHKILNNLNSEFHDKIVLRLKRNFKWTNPSEVEVKKKFPKIKIDDGTENIYSLFNNCKFLISMYFSTGVLEAISQNIPTIFYYPKEIIHIDSREKKYFDLLNEAKILSYTEDEFKNNIMYIIDNVDKWWETKNTQNAKKIFCNRFTKKVSNPISHLSKTLKSIKSETL